MVDDSQALPTTVQTALAAADFIQPIEEEHPAVGKTWADALPIHFEMTPCREYRRAREVGEDNAAVLNDWLGISAAEVARREDAGTLR